jgi:nucleotide-binding universal stress UspA family protein
MENPPFRSLLHPTDLTRGDAAAFAHAVRLAVAAQSAMHLLHVGDAAVEEEGFPSAHDLLSLWGMPAPGPEFVNAALNSEDVAQSIGAYAERHASDLLVLLTHERSWIWRLLQDSLAESAARLVHAPTLFLREGESGFVDAKTGRIGLQRVLMPVTAEVAPMQAWGFASNLVRLLEPQAEFHLLHVGDTLPTFGNMLPHVELRRGPVLETIFAVAENTGPDLIVMPTAGHQDIYDDLRGSMMERVLREAPCPVLAIPCRRFAPTR